MKPCIKIIFTFIGLSVLTGCNPSSLGYMVSSAQKQGFEVLKQFDAYEINHKYGHIQVTIDSLIQIMVNKSSDTIFMVESCNPPLYSYNAYIWNNTKQYCFGENGLVKEGFVEENRKHLFPLIERWDEREIRSISNSHHLAHGGSEDRYDIATRIIFENQKCIKAESIIYRQIDFNSNANIWNFE